MLKVSYNCSGIDSEATNSSINFLVSLRSKFVKVGSFEIISSICDVICLGVNRSNSTLFSDSGGLRLSSKFILFFTIFNCYYYIKI